MVKVKMNKKEIERIRSILPKTDQYGEYKTDCLKCCELTDIIEDFLSEVEEELEARGGQ